MLKKNEIEQNSIINIFIGCSFVKLFFCLEYHVCTEVTVCPELRHKMWLLVWLVCVTTLRNTGLDDL